MFVVDILLFFKVGLQFNESAFIRLWRRSPTSVAAVSEANVYRDFRQTFFVEYFRSLSKSSNDIVWIECIETIGKNRFHRTTNLFVPANQI